MSTDRIDNSELARFREFIYGSYQTTHHVYSDTTVANSEGRRTQIRSLLSRGLPANRHSRILDFGCGDGLLLSVAEELGYANLCGIDLVKGLVVIAQARTKASIDHGNGLEYLKKTADLSFDVVIAFDVIEHLTRPELLEWSEQISRVLARGGRLLIHVPNGGSPHCGRVRWGDLTHELAFTPNSLEQLLRPFGFRNFSAWEDAPVAHGVKSTIRAILWKVIRALIVARLAVETGAIRGHVLTINLFFAADKPF
jgi:2-polyprenyl-3-methyl-5-hydroxy-6-metoxy-1,4-benzoquinol methylase